MTQFLRGREKKEEKKISTAAEPHQKALHALLNWMRLQGRSQRKLWLIIFGSWEVSQLSMCTTCTNNIFF
jgi:hypothetical protein